MAFMQGSAGTDGDEERVAVTLVCLFCSKEQESHVSRSMVSKDRIFWECFSCQKRGMPPFPDHGTGMQ
jgi:hypothetical protein